jgi:hypothetical protein
VLRNNLSSHKFSRARSRAIRPSTAAVFMMMGLSAACTAHGNDGKGGATFSCTVSDMKLSGAPADKAALCAVFKSHVGSVLPGSNIASAADDQHADIQVDVRYEKFGAIIASVKENRGAELIRYPEISVDVLDRPIVQDDVNMLAAGVAKAIAQRRKQP